MNRLVASASALAAAGLAACASEPPPKPTPVVAAAAVAPASASEPEPPPPRSRTKIDLFVMSKCPYSIPLEANLQRALAMLGDMVDLKVDYMGEDRDGVLASMHGADEIVGDLHQVCAQEVTPRWFAIQVCQGKNRDQVGINWAACARENGESEAAVEKVESCASTEHGKELLAASFARTKSRGVNGTPTMFIGGVKYEGSRWPHALAAEICRETPNAPKTCASLPPPPRVNAIALVDSRMPSLDLGALERQLHLHVEAPSLATLEYGTTEGKALFAKLASIRLPAVVFDASLEADPESRENVVQTWHGKTYGDRVAVQIGKWNPVCVDDGGCKLDECKFTSVCRVEKPNTLDLFMMGEDPFASRGVKALVAALADLQQKKGKVDVRVFFIGQGTGAQGFASLHGPAEVEEDLRDVCVMKQYPRANKFLDFFVCRANDYKADWRACAGGATGFDAKKIEKCATTDEGKKLLEASFDTSAKYEVSASPSWFANDKFSFVTLDANEIKKNICAHNPKLGGCG